MLLTLDLNTLFEVLFDEFGDHMALEMRPMTDRQREVAEDRSGVITQIRTRFTIEDYSNPDSPVRREDLEERIVKLGRK